MHVRRVIIFCILIVSDFLFIKLKHFNLLSKKIECGKIFDVNNRSKCTNFQ